MIPRSGRSPGGGHGNPLLYSCLEHLMDRGAWRATIHGVAKSWTWLKRLSMHKKGSIKFHYHIIYFFYTDPVLENCSIYFPDDQVIFSVTHSHTNQLSLSKHICFWLQGELGTSRLSMYLYPTSIPLIQLEIFWTIYDICISISISVYLPMNSNTFPLQLENELPNN